MHSREVRKNGAKSRIFQINHFTAAGRVKQELSLAEGARRCQCEKLVGLSLQNLRAPRVCVEIRKEKEEP